VGEGGPDLRCTYRVELRPHMGFDDVAALAGYLARLGVSHVYLSPCFQAAQGSTHGYDIVDPTRFDEELGGEAGFLRMAGALREEGLGLVLDIVPNHLSAATPDNPYFWDVLENGPESRHARMFDIDWASDDPRLEGKVLLPILGGHYGRVRAEGHIRLRRDDDQVTLRVYDRALPLRRGSVEAMRGVGEDLDALLSRVHRSPNDLDALLDRQHYRLAYWRTARHELNYRRFFDIHDLLGLRVEDPDVFDLVHRLVLDQVNAGNVQGIRVDHPDGLRDPTGYFERLRKHAPRAWIVAEKILGTDEVLPERWPVDGTTGYEFLNRLTGLFVDPEGEQALTEVYEQHTGEEGTFAPISRRSKAEVLRELFGSEVQRLARQVRTVCARRPDHRDHTLPDVRKAVFALVVAMPVYRTYVRPGERASNADQRALTQAVEHVREHARNVDAELLHFLADLFSGHFEGDDEAEAVARFQQLTGPAMAKGLEDTAFYRHHRLICLNEVGGDPDRFGTTLEEFHAFCRLIQRGWPSTLLCTSTHDTKRSEDVRARIALLSEIPAAWGEAVRRWREMAAPHRTGRWPDAATEYLLLQTLVGTWPIELDRLLGFAIKAAREAKLHTSWHQPDGAYEEAVQRFVREMCGDTGFVRDLEDFLAPLLAAGQATALAQVLIKLTAPGVPDIHAGNELWRYSLVDPDNRRPVDFARRRRLLEEVQALSAREALARSDEGLPKLLLTQRTLAVRARRPECFGRDGTYDPLEVTGAHAHRIVAFARSAKVATVAPRLLASFGGRWEDTRVRFPSGRWQDAVTGHHVEGRDVRVDEILSAFPVAILVREAT
jgi:(1->4)-alpha-D-glucan 1-alpha-D-glucosylmutase